MPSQNAEALSFNDTEDSEETIEISVSEYERLHDEIDELKAEVKRLDALHKKVNTLEDVFDEYREDNERDKADIRKFAREQAGETETSTCDSGGQGDQTPDPETSLEQIVALPEHMVDEQLTANQERARFIAKDFEQYSQDCPAGRYIEAKEMRRVIHAMNGKCNTNTLSRVREFLDRLGDGEVEIVERRGTKKVVFTDELVARLKKLRRSNPEQASGRNRAAV